MADKGEARELSDILLSEETIGPIGRIFSAPFFRKESKRVSDLAAEILSYQDNGISDYIDDIQDNDQALGKKVHDEVFMGFAKETLERYRASVRLAELNDTVDKLMAIIDTSFEIAADASVVGVPVSLIYKAAGTLLPLASIATMYFNTVRRNPDKATRRDQTIYFAKAAAGLAMVEASEFMPVAGPAIGNALDVYDLYVIAANQVIARGTSREQLDGYFRQNHPTLYAQVHGGPIIDVPANDEPPGG